jgi:hypothetical protein
MVDKMHVTGEEIVAGYVLAKVTDLLRPEP